MAASTMLSAPGDILDKKAGSKNNRKSARSKRPAQPPIKCPECGSLRIWKDGLRYTNLGPIQRYICRNCAYRFSDPDFQHAFNGSGTFQHVQKVHRQNLKRHTDIPNSRQVCAALTRGAKNLTTVETRHEKAAGATTKQEFKGRILHYCWKLNREGFSQATIRTYNKTLMQLLSLGANLYDPEHVKEVLSKQRNWNDNTKIIAVNAYNSFLEYELEITWKKPRYRKQEKIPHIPTEQDIDTLIVGSGKKLSTFLQLLKETGARCGEIIRLEWADIDFQQRIIRIKAEKNSNPRILPVSTKLTVMLKQLSKKSKRIFPGTLGSMRFNLQITRKRLAWKLNNPRLHRVSFHSIRHWKGTTLYHKTKDILYVKEFLGHRNIKSTMFYINIERVLFTEAASEEFHVKVAETPGEIKSLLEVGFEYVCQKDKLMFLRKRK